MIDACVDRLPRRVFLSCFFFLACLRRRPGIVPHVPGIVPQAPLYLWAANLRGGGCRLAYRFMRMCRFARVCGVRLRHTAYNSSSEMAEIRQVTFSLPTRLVSCVAHRTACCGMLTYRVFPAFPSFGLPPLATPRCSFDRA